MMEEALEPECINEQELKG